MRKVLKKLIPAILIGVLAAGLAACGGSGGGSSSGGSSGGSSSKLTTYIFDGFTAQLPKGEVDDMEGFVAYYYNDNFMMSALKEDQDTFGQYGADINDYTLEDYAELVLYANEIDDDTFQEDEYGNLYITYERESGGQDFFYYSTVKEGTQSFWVITFACFDGEEGTYLPQFKEYASLLEFD